MSKSWKGEVHPQLKLSGIRGGALPVQSIRRARAEFHHLRYKPKLEYITPVNCVDSSRKEDGPIVQYVVVRSDLHWSQGAMIAQACHASVASIARTLDCPMTKKYLDNLNGMHKVVLQADKLEDLQKAETKLKEANVPCHMWIEQPENVPTCLACSPQPKPLVQAMFRHLKLLK